MFSILNRKNNNVDVKQIPKINLVLKKTNESKDLNIGFKYGPPKKTGKRFQLGGIPTWIQNPERVICKSCKKPMTFYAQLDSINDEYMIGDTGLIYVFICFNCVETESIIQTY